MCDFMGLRSFGPDALLRFTLRSKLRELRSDDKDILWEGVGTLTQDELDVALRARGLPYHGLNTSQKRDALQAPSLTRARAHPAPPPPHPVPVYHATPATRRAPSPGRAGVAAALAEQGDPELDAAALEHAPILARPRQPDRGTPPDPPTPGHRRARTRHTLRDAPSHTDPPHRRRAHLPRPSRRR